MLLSQPKYTRRSLVIFIITTIVIIVPSTFLLIFSWKKNISRYDDAQTSRLQSPQTPTNTTPVSIPSTSTSKKTLREESVVFQNNQDVSRPEMCIVNNRAYVSMRHALKTSNALRTQIEIVLKIFDITTEGNWTDVTLKVFGNEFFILYPANGPEGNFTDHQMLCDNTTMYLQFEAYEGRGSSGTKKIIVQRRSFNGEIQKTTRLFEGSASLEEYKTDDAGFSFFHNTLWVWVVHLGPTKLANGFALYGLDPQTLNTIIDDGNVSSKNLENPLAAPFAGVMNNLDGEYHLLSSPHDQTKIPPFTMNGLVDYTYDTSWELVRSEKITLPFTNATTLYTTGRMSFSHDVGEVWGFLVRPFNIVGVTNTIDDQNIGESWIRIVSNDGEQEYMKVSTNDGTQRSDDTRHIEFAQWNDILYVGYAHLDGNAQVVIKKFRFL